MEFNVNECVFIKLTDFGRDIHKEKWERIWQSVEHKFTYVAPKEDENGWSKWQMWELMNEFGDFVSMGVRLPFETTIHVGELKEPTHD